jgi:hypothetical protein
MHYLFDCVVNAVQGFHHRFEREGGHFEQCNFFNKRFCTTVHTLNFLFIIRICPITKPLKLYSAYYHTNSISYSKSNIQQAEYKN